MLTPPPQALSPWVQAHFFGSSLTFMLVYIWARRNAHARVGYVCSWCVAWYGHSFPSLILIRAWLLLLQSIMGVRVQSTIFAMVLTGLISVTWYVLAILFLQWRALPRTSCCSRLPTPVLPLPGHPIQLDLLGLLAGHMYYYAMDVYPEIRQTRGWSRKNLLPWPF